MPCEACSWTPERQNRCRYDSHVKLFYGVSDRGVWSLGSQFILKERSSNPPNFEASNIRFLKEKTSIPVPTIIEDWKKMITAISCLQSASMANHSMLRGQHCPRPTENASRSKRPNAFCSFANSIYRRCRVSMDNRYILLFYSRTVTVFHTALFPLMMSC